jgi:hypothetical protein
LTSILRERERVYIQTPIFRQTYGWCEINRMMRCRRRQGQIGRVDMFVITSSSTFQKQTRLDMCQQTTPLVCQENNWVNHAWFSYSMTAYSPRGTRHVKIHSPEYVTAYICALPKTKGKHKVQPLAKKTRDTGPISTRNPQLKETVGALQLSPRTGAVRLILRL